MIKHFKPLGLKVIVWDIGFSKKMEKKILNFHFTDRCNFHCKHCFVNMTGRGELTLNECKMIIDRICEMKEFARINLAGGEPMMALYLQDIIDYVVLKGFQCSIITNGSYLTEDFIYANKNKLSMIGISIDSMDDAINELIGRETIKNIESICSLIKRWGIKLKINICVSKKNLNCDFNSFIESLKPDRLKIFQMLPSQHIKNSNKFEITKEEFLRVCFSLKKFRPVCEDNEVMKDAYWIVDSEGYYGKDNLHLDNKSKVKLI